MHHFYRKNNKLKVEGVDVGSLVQKFGSPLYIYSAQTILDHYRDLDSALSALDHRVCYAVKANSNLSVLSLLAKEGAGFDIVSGGELLRVLKAGGKANRCTFAGVGKTPAEIELALRKGIYCFNVESLAELEQINRIALKLKKTAPVSIRVNPDIDAGTHKKITTGTYDSKFGIPFENALAVYAKAARMKGVQIRGVQIHIGSQITKVKPFVDSVKKMLPLVKTLKKRHDIEFFDLGGGLGIVYQDALASGQPSWWKRKNPPLTPQGYASALIPLLKDLDLKILVEPGRFIAGNAGILATEVLYLKQTGKRNFIIVDASMTELVRPAMYESYHEVVPVNARKGKTFTADVVGPVCESGDVFGKGYCLPSVRQGDVLALMSAGAYGFVMASNYNTRPRPAEVLVHGKSVKLVRSRESVEDLWEEE